MAVRKSRRKVIGLWGGRKTVSATSVDRRRARQRADVWFGQWFAHTPPWWATRRAQSIKKRRG